jgi:hypothetical protein
MRLSLYLDLNELASNLETLRVGELSERAALASMPSVHS